MRHIIWLFGFLGICQIIFEVVFKSSEMVKGMVTDAVSRSSKLDYARDHLNELFGKKYPCR